VTVFVVNNEYTKEELKRIVSKKTDVCMEECAGIEEVLENKCISKMGTTCIIFVNMKDKKGTDSVLQVQTFGNFEVFYMGKPVIFNRNKSKELLAYLVDRRGASVTTAEACGILWEDKEYDFSLQRQFQTVVSDLMKALQKCNCTHIIYRKRNCLCINTSDVDCDVYRLMDGDESVMAQYRGEYMSNYSWAEITAGYLAMKYGTRRAGE